MDKKLKTDCDKHYHKCSVCSEKGTPENCTYKVEKRRIIQNACGKVYGICQELSLPVSRMVWDQDAMATGMENSKASMIIITQSGLHRQPLCRNRREWTYEKGRKAAVSGRDPACHRRACFFCMETERNLWGIPGGRGYLRRACLICGGAGGYTKPDGEEPDAEPDGYLQIDFEGLQAVNPDVIGWIDIPGLSISYPVVQGTDNAYYLHHLFTGEYNSSGSIFADWHNQPDFTDPEHHCIRPQYEKRQYVWNPFPLSGSGSVGSISLLLPVCAGEGAEISDLLLLCRVCRERGLHLCVSGRGRLSGFSEADPLLCGI